MESTQLFRTINMDRSTYSIRDEAIGRDIRHLYHFTAAANIESILTHGLISRAVLEENDKPYFASDEVRLDEHLDGISVSIHSINTAMFEAKQKKYKSDWLILVLDASILWTHECRFCWVNAAKSEMRRHNGYMGGPWAFQKMFEDRKCLPGEIGWREGKFVREAYELKPFDPTNEDAEVQVLSRISPELILGVVVPSIYVENQLKALMERIDRPKPVSVNESYFL